MGQSPKKFSLGRALKVELDGTAFIFIPHINQKSFSKQYPRLRLITMAMNE